jgi:radical SAM superfamily enzyme YgiQ (UPF0313 family)
MMLAPLVEAGLRHVYLGVEAGDEDDLVHLNKLMTANAHQAGTVLRELGLSFDFGFMLLNPWSTVESVMNNIEFLGAFAGDGATAVNFCRMLPYVGTPAAERLLAEGRLERDNLDADYSSLIRASITSASGRSARSPTATSRPTAHSTSCASSRSRPTWISMVRSTSCSYSRCS